MSISSLKTRLVLCLGLLSSSCQGLPIEPQPDCLVQGTWGFASGADAQEAVELSGYVEEVLEVYSALPNFNPTPLRLHYVDADFASGTKWAGKAGVTVRLGNSPPFIAFARDQEDPLFICAHEMAHLYFADLHEFYPQIIQEGICELQAEMVVPAKKRFASMLVLAAQSYLDRYTIRVEGGGGKDLLPMFVERVHSIEEALSQSNEELHAASSRSSTADYGLGWMIAKLIGWDGLLELVRRTKSEGLKRVPMKRILQAAGLFPLDQDHLRVAFQRSFGVPYSAASQEIVLTLKGHSAGKASDK